MSVATSTTPTGRRLSGPAKVLIRFFSRAHAALYRFTAGAVSGRLGRSPVLLLTTVGRKTGKERSVPLLYLTDGDRLVVVGSVGGAARHPDWWLNLRANPEARVQVGRRTLQVRAELAGPEERRRLWPLLVAMYPPYDDYQKATSREIPVIILHPLTNADATS
jgi:deazaflavin-dependent oxidoreductase (nitroreductase family)